MFGQVFSALTNNILGWNQEDQKIYVSKILVHPIKSCRGTSVSEARYSPMGLEHDRNWSVISTARNKIVTAREFPKMVLITPRIQADPSSPHGGTLHISFPEGSECEEFSVPLCPNEDLLESWQILDDLSVHDHKNIDGFICEASSPMSEDQTPSSVLSKYFGYSVHLVYKGPRPRMCDPTHDFPGLDASLWYQDGYPLLLLSEESVKAAEDETRKYVGVQGVEEAWANDNLVIERFRPNIILSGGSPFAEDQWEEIVINNSESDDSGTDGMHIQVVSKCTRCLLPNVHPDTGVRDKAVPFKVLMKFRSKVDPRLKNQACMGVNGLAADEGLVKVGEWVHVKKLLSPPEEE